MNLAKRLAGQLIEVASLRNYPRYWDFRYRALRGSEDRYTTPREDCPKPWRWTSTDWDSTETEVTELVAAFVRALQPDFVVETGTAYGHTAVAIGHALRKNGQGRLVTLDVNPHRVELARTRVRKLPVEVLEVPSLDYTPTEPIDFAWFDSLSELRELEFRHYFPHMHSATIVGFHDSGPQHDLHPRISKLADEGLLQYIDLATPRGVTFGQPLGRPSPAALTRDSRVPATGHA